MTTAKEAIPVHNGRQSEQLPPEPLTRALVCGDRASNLTEREVPAPARGCSSEQGRERQDQKHLKCQTGLDKQALGEGRARSR
jgi:hypothetical protein